MSKLLSGFILAIFLFIAAAFPDLSQASEPSVPKDNPPVIQEEEFEDNEFIMGDGAHKRAKLAAKQNNYYLGE